MDEFVYLNVNCPLFFDKPSATSLRYFKHMYTSLVRKYQRTVKKTNVDHQALFDDKTGLTFGEMALLIFKDNLRRKIKKHIQ